MDDCVGCCGGCGGCTDGKCVSELVDASIGILFGILFVLFEMLLLLVVAAAFFAAAVCGLNGPLPNSSPLNCSSTSFTILADLGITTG